MLLLIDKLSELRFLDLMDVYRGSNIQNGSKRYPNESHEIQLINAENDFYCYLKSVFFHQPDSLYAIWEAGGHYQAALRLEPYSDGTLLCALETAPGARRQGFAVALIQAVLTYLREANTEKVYSHVAKNNLASIAVHQKCGFQILKNYAVYSDGSVFHNTITLGITLNKSEI